MRKINLLLLITFLLVLNSHAQQEDGNTNGPDQDGWSFSAAPYLWLAGFRAETSFVETPPRVINADYLDIRDQLDLGGSFHLEAKNGRFI